MYVGPNNKPEQFVLKHLQSVFCQIMTFHNQMVPMKELVLFLLPLFMCQIVFIIVLLFFSYLSAPSVHSVECQVQYCLLCSI
jgi:hypothetical protein